MDGKQVHQTSGQKGAYENDNNSNEKIYSISDKGRTKTARQQYQGTVSKLSAFLWGTVRIRRAGIPS